MHQYGGGTFFDGCRNVRTTIAGSSRASNKHVTHFDQTRVLAQILTTLSAAAQERNNVLTGDAVVEQHGFDHLDPPCPAATTVEAKGASGCTPKILSVLPTIEEYTGAATSPP